MQIQPNNIYSGKSGIENNVSCSPKYYLTHFRSIHAIYNNDNLISSGGINKTISTEQLRLDF